MPDVRMPDGTVIRNVPEGTTKSELLRRLGRAPQQPQAQASTVSGPLVFTEEAVRGFLDNIIGLPQAALNLSAATARAVGLPAGPTVDLGLPDVNDLVAGEMSLVRGIENVMRGESPDFAGQFRRERERLNQRLETIEREAPIATALGRTTGDIATMITGRAPFVRAAARGRAPRTGQGGANLQPGTRRAVKRWMNSEGVQSLRRGAGKVGEATLEGAVMGALNDGDPLETAALAAGTQTAGSMGLSALEAATMRRGKLSAYRILGTAGTLWALHRLGQEFGPAANDSWAALDDTFNSIMWATASGIASGLLGAGRFRGATADDFPVIMDSVTTMPRAAVQSFLSSMTKEDEREVVAPVVGKLTQDPLYFGKEQGERLTRAMRQGKLFETVERMRKSEDFRRKFDALTSGSN